MKTQRGLRTPPWRLGCSAPQTPLSLANWRPTPERTFLMAHHTSSNDACVLGSSDYNSYSENCPILLLPAAGKAFVRFSV